MLTLCGNSGDVLLGSGNHSRLVQASFVHWIWLFSTKEHVPNRFWLR